MRSAFLKTGALLAVVCLLLYALMETVFASYNVRVERFFRLAPHPETLEVAEAKRFMEGDTFDPDLGWDVHPVARHFDPEADYVAQSYGDSFTYGDEVEDPDTWQSRFGKLTGRGIVNLGAHAYGLDQAVLKFEKYGGKYPGRVAILSLFNQEYRRALSYYAYYYFRRDHYRYIFKPVFIPGPEGYVLVKPPCRDPECLMGVLRKIPPEIRNILSDHDYWYRDNQRRPARGFPHAIGFLRVFPLVLQEKLMTRGFYNYFFVNDESITVAKYLIERFVNECRRLGKRPLFFVIEQRRDLLLLQKGKRYHQAMIDFLEERNLPYVDGGAYMVEHWKADDGFRALLADGGHFNGRGNQMLADALARHPLLGP